jgi:uncharacterized protein (DUF433 family)
MHAWNNCSALESNRDKLAGEWIFKNTRVPIRALFQNLASGASIDEFLDWFPGVERAQVLTVFEFLKAGLSD